MEAKDYTSVLRIADPVRVNGGIPPFTRTGFCQKKRGGAAECGSDRRACERRLSAGDLGGSAR